MKRIACVFAVLALLLSALPCFAEGIPAEGYATPTDLCAHETQKTTYYFDAPEYRPLNAEYHRVIGTAIVEVTCLDCGAVLSVSTHRNVEKHYHHVFRNGKCALCGQAGEPAATPEPKEEEVRIILPLEDLPNQYACTLMERDLDPEQTSLVLRPEEEEFAIVLRADLVREDLVAFDGTLTAELRIPEGEDNTVNAAIRMYDAEGNETKPDFTYIALRIYGDRGGDSLSVSYTDPEGVTVWEEAGWSPTEDEGYWTVPWKGNGTYKY